MHPENKRDRFVKGDKKGKKRVKGMMSKDPKFVERNIKLHRDTTKLCSCAMCGNPRKHLKTKKTTQEIKQQESEHD